VAFAPVEYVCVIEGGGGSSELSGMTVQSWYGGGASLGSFPGGGPGGGSYTVESPTEGLYPGGGPVGGWKDILSLS